MPAEVIHIYRSAPQMLRVIADRMERGEVTPSAVVIAATDVFLCEGGIDDRTSAQTVVFWCTYAISKMMHPLLKSADND